MKKKNRSLTAGGFAHPKIQLDGIKPMCSALDLAKMGMLKICAPQNRGGLNLSNNELHGELFPIAYQVNDSLQAGGESVKVGALTNTATLTYGITGNQLVKNFVNLKRLDTTPFTQMGDKPDLPDIQGNNVTLFSNINNNIRCSYLSIGLSINTLCEGILTAGGIPPLRNWLLSSTENTVVKYNQGVMTSPAGGCRNDIGVTDNKKGSTANATPLNSYCLKFYINDKSNTNANLFNILVQRRLIIHYSLDCLVLRCLRLISVLIAEDINWPVLSPCSFVCSIPSINSCNTLTVTDCDFEFLEPVAITESLFNRCKTVYTKKSYFKELTCKTPCNYDVSYTSMSKWCRNSETPQCWSTNGASNHNVNRGNTMAMYKSTQTHPKFIWRFFSEYENQLIRCSSCAATEEEARALIPFTYLIFTARISLGVSHA